MLILPGIELTSTEQLVINKLSKLGLGFAVDRD